MCVGLSIACPACLIEANIRAGKQLRSAANSLLARRWNVRWHAGIRIFRFGHDARLSLWANKALEVALRHVLAYNFSRIVHTKPTRTDGLNFATTTTTACSSTMWRFFF